MLEEFESYFDIVDVKDLRQFLKEAKEESEWIREQGDESAEDVEDVVKFMSAVIENLEEEISGVNSLSELDFKQKVKVYAMVHLFHDICHSMDEDLEDYEEIDNFGAGEELHFEENTDPNNDKGSNDINGQGRIIKLE